MRRLIDKLRAVMGREGEVMPEIGGNASDDERPMTLQETEGDLLLEELEEEIEAMDEDHRIELVALMWVGRGDFSAGEWQEALELARERQEGPTARYLLSHPRVADQIASGLEGLGHSHILQDGLY
ncbi:MAG: DUF3775 domain-containing protein [Litoreibacter sp.]|nr:DUF3775 domain-containing protein [Litoreibacter sp.]